MGRDRGLLVWRLKAADVVYFVIRELKEGAQVTLAQPGLFSPGPLLFKKLCEPVKDNRER